MSKVHAGGKDKSEKVHESATSPSAGHVPPPTAVTTADEGGVEEYFAKKSLKTMDGQSERKTQGGALAQFQPAPGAKPASFFELLAAAFSNAKLEQEKGPSFLEYLKKSGIKMAWVRAIVALYEEPKKPDDPLAYIVKLMGHGIPEPIDVKHMQDEVARLRGKLLHLQAENEQLRESVEKEEDALQKKEELVSLFDESKFFSEYNSDDDDDGAEEMQHGYNYRISKG